MPTTSEQPPESQITDHLAKESTSIYLDNGADNHVKPVTPKPRTRLTMAERAKLEALASFGGATLESVMKKPESFKDKLQKQKQALQAQSELNSAGAEPRPPQNKAFDSGLGDLRVKKVDLKAKLKQEAAERGKENECLPPSSKSRHQLAHEKMQAGLSLGDCVKHEGRDGLPSFRQTAQNSNSTTEGAQTSTKRLTKVERSKMEALQSFGAGLDDLAIKPKIPKVLEEKLAMKRK